MIGQNHDLLGHHHLDELLVVDLAIAINIGFADHFIDLFYVRKTHYSIMVPTTFNPESTRLSSFQQNVQNMYLLVCELLAQVGHDVAQLGGGDETVAIAIENLEGLDELLLCVGVLHLAGHKGKELGEINGAWLV